MDTTSLPGLLTLADAAPLIGRTTARLRQCIADGRLPARKIANVWLVRREDVLRIPVHKRGRITGLSPKKKK